MIRTLESDRDKLIIKDYPLRWWLAFIFLAMLIIICNYYLFFILPVSSSLTCTKNFLNTTNCELVESSVFNKNLTHQTITNIYKVKQGIGSKSNSILLKTKIKLRGYIKNIYFPSRSLIRTKLYRSKNQLQREIEQINNFIHSWNNKTPILNVKMPPLFFLVIWLMPLTILVPLTVIFICPIITYTFESQKNSLTIQELILFSTEEKRYSLNKLEIDFSIEKDDRHPSISIKTDRDKTYTINDFENKVEAIKLLKSLKKFIPTETVK